MCVHSFHSHRWLLPIYCILRHAKYNTQVESSNAAILNHMLMIHYCTFSSIKHKIRSQLSETLSPRVVIYLEIKSTSNQIGQLLLFLVQKYNPHDLLFSEINLCCKIDIYTFSFSIELTFSSISYTWSIFSFHSEIYLNFIKIKTWTEQLTQN